MTGSFVVAGSELVADNDGFLIKVLAIPVFFAAGVVTTVIVTAFGARDRRALVATLALEAALLVGLAWVGASAGIHGRQVDGGTVRPFGHGNSERLGSPAAA